MSKVKPDDLSIAKAPIALVDLPLVSIIIITYNDRKDVGKTINRALAQTYPSCEVIVVNDGSANGTGKFILKHYSDLVLYQW